MYPTEDGGTMSVDAIEGAVLRRAAMLASGPERRMATWRHPRWQVPSRLTRRGSLAGLVVRDGWDATAYRVLAARWLVLAVPFTVAGSIAVGMPVTLIAMIGALLLVPAAVAVVCAAVRTFQWRAARRPAGPRPPAVGANPSRF